MFLRGHCIAGAALSLLAGVSIAVAAQQPATATPVDSDHDGLNDALEQKLLQQFLPSFMIGQHDCSVAPAEFRPNEPTPAIVADNGTVYGQAFLVKQPAGRAPVAELHFYHLWRKDCGGHGHALDTEHVAVLIEAAGAQMDAARWRATYWYAAAHEDTVCDVSQIARASTLHAEDHGATVWVSPGKHASYLNGKLCLRGCGADRCEIMTQLQPAGIINLGEPGAPMNGSTFIASPAWPLLAKMSTSNFPGVALARVDALPATSIAWFNPGRHPLQGIIANSSSTEQALATGERSTATAISLAGDSTGNALSEANGSTGSALSTAGSSTGGALQKSYRNTRHAVGTSARHVGRALHVIPRTDDAAPR